MSVSPELTGGAGFTFEDGVVAFYLSALLTEGGVQGLRDCIATGVSVQRAALGEPLDDIIVDGETRSGLPARLCLQVKRALSFSSVASNTDLSEIVDRSWRTLAAGGFRTGIDRVGAATHDTSSEAERDVRTTCQWGRDSASAADFLA